MGFFCAFHEQNCTSPAFGLEALSNFTKKNNCHMAVKMVLFAVADACSYGSGVVLTRTLTKEKK